MKLTARPSDSVDAPHPTPECLPNGGGHPEAAPALSADVFLPVCLFKSESQVLSPLIFTKRMASVKPDERMSPATLLLESLCALVSRFYYKSTFEVAEFMRELLAAFEAGKKPSDLKKTRRRTGPGIRKHRRVDKKERGERETEEVEPPADPKLLTPNEELNILDFLVSPLKTDFCVGELNRAVECEGSGGVRGRIVRFWEAVRPDRGDGGLSRWAPRTRRTSSNSTTCGRRPPATASGSSTANSSSSRHSTSGTK